MKTEDTKVVIEPIPLERALSEAHKQGIREVVEWFMENYPEVCDSHLETQLKEWGIE